MKSPSTRAKWDALELSLTSANDLFLAKCNSGAIISMRLIKRHVSFAYGDELAAALLL
jgi:hypothetical protein